MAIFHALGCFVVMNVTCEVEFGPNLIVIITLFRFVLNVKIIFKGGLHFQIIHA